MNSIDPEISNRIAILRYIMIFGIIILHIPPYIPLAETGILIFDFVKATFQHAIFRSSVPVLTFISGYLLFSTNLDKGFRFLLAKKTKTILIPLILFNLPIALAVYIMQANQLINHEFSQQLYPFTTLVWIDAITGLFGSPINYPLNFLRDLFLISILSPVFGILLRRFAWPGLLLIFIIFWFNLDDNLILRNTMPIVFYLGGMAAIQEWDLKRLDNYALVFLLLFISFCIAIIFFQIENRNYLRIVSPILIWPAASLLVNTKLGKWIAGLSKFSFLTFLMQGPMLLVIWLIYQRVFFAVPYWFFWVLTPFITAAITALIYVYSHRIFPKTMSTLLGGR